MSYIIEIIRSSVNVVDVASTKSWSKERVGVDMWGGFKSERRTAHPHPHPHTHPQKSYILCFLSTIIFSNKNIKRSFAFLYWTMRVSQNVFLPLSSLTFMGTHIHTRIYRQNVGFDAQKKYVKI
jgi:hypothetical protein